MGRWGRDSWGSSCRGCGPLTRQNVALGCCWCYCCCCCWPCWRVQLMQQRGGGEWQLAPVAAAFGPLFLTGQSLLTHPITCASTCATLLQASLAVNGGTAVGGGAGGGQPSLQQPTASAGGAAGGGGGPAAPAPKIKLKFTLGQRLDAATAGTDPGSSLPPAGAGLPAAALPAAASGVSALGAAAPSAGDAGLAGGASASGAAMAAAAGAAAQAGATAPLAGQQQPAPHSGQAPLSFQPAINGVGGSTGQQQQHGAAAPMQLDPLPPA